MGAEPWLLVAEGGLAEEAEITLDPGEARHLTNVLRRRPGDAVVLADGAGRVGAGRIVKVSRSEVVVAVTGVETLARRERGIGLALGVLHTQAMDWAVQKAVEVGAERFVPLVCDRSQGGSARARGRVEHWQRIADQALKQCRRPWRMPVTAPMDFDECVGGGLEPGWVAEADGADLDDVDLARGRDLLVGPEGGWTLAEAAALAAAGWPQLTLGPHVLRAETAAVVGVALLGERLRSRRAGGGGPDDG